VKKLAAQAWLIAVLGIVGGCADTLSVNQPSATAVAAPAPAPLLAPALEILFDPEETLASAPKTPQPPQLTRPEISEPGRIALLLPLSGPEQALGRSLLDAAIMALNEIGGDELVLLPRDTLGTPEGARIAADLALQEGAQLILGPVFSASVAAAAIPARARGVNMVAFSTDAAVAGGGVFLLAFMPQQQVERVVGYAVSQGLRRFAALAPESPYGFTVVEALQSTVKINGALVTKTLLYPETEQDLMDTVQMLAEGALGYDAVLLPEGGSRLRQIAPLLPFFDIDPKMVRFLGTGLWEDPALGQEPALVGGWFAAPPPGHSGLFFERFTRLYGYRPSRIATLAYDAVALAAVLSRNADANFSMAKLTSPSGFAGADGIFRFLNNGMVERGLAIIEVEARGLKVIDPAPVTFQVPVN
jgi:ABC-type branched-subunit amino acid transport system substrate-binding protein